jgi:serine/threonine-protein kinase
MQLPARIGKYELEEFLGGGMSHVYRSRDTVIGRTVAVKILTEQGCEDEEVKARFLAEARMAGNLTHDNILSIYDFGEDEQHHPFMVMEFLRGEDLRHAIKSGHTGETRDKLKIAVQVARALSYIHTQKIVHRDIKPENIHINAAGLVKLMDFGIAKTEGLAMTRAGYVLGTPYYMSPEQVMGQEITEQVDVYAFGVLLFELFAGVKPIQGDTVERIFYHILNEPLNMEPMQRAGAPQAVCDLVTHCTAKRPQERPQGFGPIIAEIEGMIEAADAPTLVLPAMPPPAAEPEPAPAPSKPAWMLPAAIAAVVALAAGLYFATRPKEPPKAMPPVVAELAKTLATPTGDMMLVPAGDFLFGEKKEKVSLPAFYIDKTEVSNAAYAQFCKETNHPLPAGFAADKADFPVVNVTVLDAIAYSKWAGKRLPNAKEWEKAARGIDGRTYPWGESSDAKIANIHTSGPQPVSANLAGASPSGALNMVGNVWELTDQEATPSEGMRKHFAVDLKFPVEPNESWYEIRGGSFTDAALNPTLLWDNSTVPARWKDGNIGFRCVKDKP